MHIALAAYSSLGPGLAELMRVAAALQRQVQRDFAPVWRVDASVAAYPTRDDVPSDAVPVLVGAPDLEVEGVHFDQNGRPFALVAYAGKWSITASHEVLELLADPDCDRLVVGPPPDELHGLGSEDVSYLVEVCDPCQNPDFGYEIDGIALSDFCTPAFYGLERAPSRVLSFGGCLLRELRVAEAGYLAWRDAQHRWSALRVLDGIGTIRPVALGPDSRPLRGRVDVSARREPQATARVEKRRAAQIAHAARSRDAARVAAHARFEVFGPTMTPEKKDGPDAR
jgi:hypothetical protein